MATYDNGSISSTPLNSSVFNHPCLSQFEMLKLNYNNNDSEIDDEITMQEKVVYAKTFFGLYCLASLFLFLTVIVYSATLKKQKLNGWTILAFSASTFSSYLFWTVGLGKWLFQTDRPCGNGIRPVLIGTSFCNVVGAIILFSDFAAFTWMTVLNFNICATIRSMKPRATDASNKRKFLIYSVIGIGVPTIVTTVSVLIEHLSGYFEDEVIRLQYGYDPCGVDKYYVTYMVKIIYAVVLLLKFVFACLVIKSLWNYKKDTKLLQQQKAPNLIREVTMYAKLLVLMDFTWIFELVWGMNYGDTNTYTWYRVVQDVIYILQAFCLFWVFVCKKEIKDMLSQEYQFCNSFFKWIDDKLSCSVSFGNQASSNSQGPSITTGSSCQDTNCPKQAQ